jgi:hypothetical protein
MHQALNFLKIILSILIFLILVIWLISQGSGHNIPLKTNFKFGITSVVLLGLLLIIIYRDKRKKLIEFPQC